MQNSTYQNESQRPETTQKDNRRGKGDKGEDMGEDRRSGKEGDRREDDKNKEDTKEDTKLSTNTKGPTQCMVEDSERVSGVSVGDGKVSGGSCCCNDSCCCNSRCNETDGNGRCNDRCNDSTTNYNSNSNNSNNTTNTNSNNNNTTNYNTNNTTTNTNPTIPNPCYPNPRYPTTPGYNWALLVGVVALKTVRWIFVSAYFAWESGATSDWPVWILICVSTGSPDVLVITVEGILSRLSSTMFFFLCTYFFCLVLSLVALLNMSTKCYTLTDNIVVSLSSFLLCFFFMLVFYAVTKEIVGGRILVALFATLIFIIIELFLIAFTVIVLSEPEIVLLGVMVGLGLERGRSGRGGNRGSNVSS